MPRTPRAAPRDYAADPDRWTDDPIGYEPAERARRLAVALSRAVEGRTLRDVESATGVNRQTVLNVVGGKHWPDVEIVAKLEQGLRRRLWPARPTRRPSTGSNDGGGGGRRVEQG